MTITLTGPFAGHRPAHPATEAPLTAVAPSEPALCSLGSTFDDTAWAASIGCRPLFATRTTR